MTQHNTTISQGKLCNPILDWNRLTFEGYYDPITGNSAEQPSQEGTIVSTYYNTVRMDTVTRTTVTVVVED